jgi:preprotein translocase subunit YajC
MLISTAFAQEGGDGGGLGGPDLLTSLLPLVLIFVVFYFLMIRPQQKKMKEHRGMVANLRRGDRVVTGGGLVGIVTRVINDGEVQVEIADGVRVRVLRHTITSVLGKGEPAKSEPTAAGSNKS